ncbi:MAG: transglutaminase-like cysteine peptidase [Gemmatimonadota bacterium]|nr:MAG: transglutaminase-like cysteine peptidase [Gemmatimonadota bacterium]
MKVFLEWLSLGAARWLLRPVLRLSLRYVDVEDPWEPTDRPVRFWALGAGSVKRFSWYFEGESSVRISFIDELCDWLLGCEQVTDPDLFHEADYWQHPSTFEQLRKGDCEDFALWAWRKLSEMGIEARFFTGRRADAPADSWHAWVVYRMDSVDYLLESIAPSRQEMLRLLEDVRSQYIPHFSVGKDFRPQAYGGYLLYLKEGGLRAKEAVPPTIG